MKNTELMNMTATDTPTLIIIDPLDGHNNVGRSTHKIPSIRTAFQIALLCISTNKRCGNERCPLLRRMKDIDKKKIDVPYKDNPKPCCILKRMFEATDTFLKRGHMYWGSFNSHDAKSIFINYKSSLKLRTFLLVFSPFCNFRILENIAPQTTILYDLVDC